MINEDFLREDTSVVTGEQIADMLGMGDIYRKGKEEIAQDEAMVESVKGKFSNMMQRLNENDKKNKKDIID